jgi:hypothetical protein
MGAVRRPALRASPADREHPHAPARTTATAAAERDYAMSFDLRTALGTIAPTLATMLGGPLAGAAVTALEGAFGLAPGSGTDAITKVVQSGAMTNETLAAVRAADQKHAELMGQQGIDLVKINADHEAALASTDAADRTSARQTNASKDQTWWIAIAILGTFASIMGVVLWGCWMLLQGGITIKDVSVVAAISGLVGSVVGYVAANAQTVVNFIFGGSLGSERKTRRRFRRRCSKRSRRCRSEVQRRRPLAHGPRRRPGRRGARPRRGRRSALQALASGVWRSLWARLR